LHKHIWSSDTVYLLGKFKVYPTDMDKEHYRVHRLPRQPALLTDSSVLDEATVKALLRDKSRGNDTREKFDEIKTRLIVSAVPQALILLLAFLLLEMLGQ